VPRLLAEKGNPIAVAEALYVRCLSRALAPDETGRIEPRLSAAVDKEKALEDLFWALLNSNEFLFNH
jgi:hypothetical protein